MIYGLIGFLIGGLILFLILNPKRMEIERVNQETHKLNLEAQEKHSQLLREIEEDNKKIKELNIEFQNTHTKYLESREKVDEAINNAEKDINRAKDSYRKELLELREELVLHYLQEQQDIKVKTEAKQSELLDLTEKINSIIEANRRSEEMKTKIDFYRLQISADDVKEISLLREIEYKFRDASPLNKVIYKVYYENQYSALVGRLFGEQKTVTGIYKITNIENNMCYIGQSTNVRERFRQHIKCGVGADTPAKNKLYPALKEIGVENFTFELLEECSQEQLDEKEKFYIDFYKSVDYGYNIMSGAKKK